MKTGPWLCCDRFRCAGESPWYNALSLSSSFSHSTAQYLSSFSDFVPFLLSEPPSPDTVLDPGPSALPCCYCLHQMPLDICISLLSQFISLSHTCTLNPASTGGIQPRVVSTLPLLPSTGRPLYCCCSLFMLHYVCCK